MGDWDTVVDLIGFEASEKIREVFARERIAVPARPPRSVIVPAVVEDLGSMSYKEVAKKYGLSYRTITRYEKWKIRNGVLISPDGAREYLLRKIEPEEREGNTFSDGEIIES
jgi:hypothetical protein